MVAILKRVVMEEQRPSKLALFIENPQKTFSLRRELTEWEQAEYREAVARLVKFVDDQQRFDLVREGFGEYKLLVEKYAQRFARQPRLNRVIQGEISNRVNGKLRNFFSEFRAFLDYTESYLNTQYGKNSKEFKDFKAACSREYDSEISYRFVYQLRSYAQHSGVPINNMSITSGNFDPTLGDYRNHLLLEIDRDRLLNAPFKWTAKVRQDIEGFPPKFELDPHIVNMFMCLERINNAAVVTMLPALKRYAEVVVNRVEELGDEQGTPALVHFNPPRARVGETVKLNMNFHWIPIDLARCVLRLPEPAELGKNDVFMVDFKSPPQPHGDHARFR